MKEEHILMNILERAETDRLILRRPRTEDAGAIFSRYANDPEVTRYLSWPRHTSVEDSKRFIVFSDCEWERWPVGPYLVESKENGLLLGSTGLAFESSLRASTGYVFRKDAWGKGYATEAVRAVVEIGRTAGLTRLYAVCHTVHTASAHVLEKCGFLREGLLRRHCEFPNLDGRAHNIFHYGFVYE